MVQAYGLSSFTSYNFTIHSMSQAKVGVFYILKCDDDHDQDNECDLGRWWGPS